MSKKSEAVSLLKGLASGSPEDRKFHAEFVKAREEGVAEGRRLQRADMLGWLQRKYLSEALTRHSVEGEAILRLVRELTSEFDEG